MIIVVTFVANAGLNFALGLLVARFLGPQDFGLYAVAASVAVVLNAILFDWLRLSATRFYSGRTRDGDPGLRSTLELGYAATALVLAAVAVAAVASGRDLGLPALLVAAAAGTGLCMGLFDYATALARARFLERTYATLVLVKNGAAFGLMLGAAVLFRSPALVLAGSCLSSLAALLIARRALADRGVRPRSARRDVAVLFARYALPLVAANVLYQLIPFLNRTVLAATGGFAEAGQFSLAADMGARLFMTAGSALDILLFQIAVRIDETHGRAEAERQIGRNAAMVAAVLMPFAAGYALVLPAFESLLVPADFRGHFAAYTLVLIPAMVAFGLILYALNPVFQLHKRTAPVVLAAAVALVLDGALLLVLPPMMGPVGFAAAQLAGYAAALVVVAALALGGGIRLPWRDLALVTAATAVMALALWPLRGGDTPLRDLAAMIGLGGLVYCGLTYAFDIAGLRTLALERLLLRRVRRAPAE